MANFVRAANPIWLFVDLTGNVLDDSYYFFPLTNTFPYIPQNVYQDNQGMTPWSQPIQFLPNGTLPDNLYFEDDLVYRLEIHQGPTQADQLIYEIDNFVPADISTITPTNQIQGAQNQISNPLFSVVNFIIPPGQSNPQLTLTAAGTYNIAPGWNLILQGSGTTTVTQVPLAGNTITTPTNNPPYALDFNSSGWSAVILSQTFNHNGAIFAGGAIVTTITARSITTAQTLVGTYVPFSASSVQIYTHQFGLGQFTAFTQAINLDASLNSTSSTTANVMIQITLPSTGEVQIANIQVVGQSDPLPSPVTDVSPVTYNLPFMQITNEQAFNSVSYVYEPQLAYKQIQSYLVGWDFPLNPAQFLGDSVSAFATGANTSNYVWDQTIVFQSATSGFTAARSAQGGLLLTATKTVQLAVIQYLPAVQARKILNDQISVNVSAIASAVAGLGGTVSLWYTTNGSLPSTVGSSNSLVTALDANGKPSVVAGWSEVPRANLQNAFFTVAQSSTTNFNDYGFNGWNLNGISAANTATYFAIVVGFAAMANTDTINLNSISLVSGAIPTRPAPQTFDEALRCCQHYYEKSYEVGTKPGTPATLLGIRSQVADLFSPTTLYECPFTQTWMQYKAILPTVTFYATDGTANVVELEISTATTLSSNKFDITEWTVYELSKSNILLNPNQKNTQTASADNANFGKIKYHYVCDARLGQ